MRVFLAESRAPRSLPLRLSDPKLRPHATHHTARFAPYPPVLRLSHPQLIPTRINTCLNSFSTLSTAPGFPKGRPDGMERRRQSPAVGPRFGRADSQRHGFVWLGLELGPAKAPRPGRAPGGRRSRSSGEVLKQNGSFSTVSLVQRSLVSTASGFCRAGSSTQARWARANAFLVPTVRSARQDTQARDRRGPVRRVPGTLLCRLQGKHWIG